MSDISDDERTFGLTEDGSLIPTGEADAVIGGGEIDAAENILSAGARELSATELVDDAAATVRNEWERIQDRITALEYEKARVADELRVMRTAETLWTPIHNRLVHGVQTRRRKAVT